MKIKITTVSTSKKGTIWIQASLVKHINGIDFAPQVGEVYDCEEAPKDKKEEPSNEE